MAAVDILAFSCVSCLTDHPSLGRKKVIYLGMLIMALSTILAIMVGESSLLLLSIPIMVLKFAASVTFVVISQ